MCGIVGYAGREEPQDILLAGLEKLEYRGYDSAGIAVVNEEGLQIRKAVGPLANLRKTIGRERLGGKAGIGHTRWATHGAPSTANAHPHTDMDGILAVVHNGTIENYAEKKEALLAEGVRFRSDTDTEVAVMLLAKHYRETRDLKTAMDRTTAELKGTYVLVAVAAGEPERIVAHRRNAPLIAARGKGFNLLASDFSAVLKYAKDVYLIENGDTVVVTPDEITIYDEQDRLVKRELMHIGWDAEAAEKGGFPHFMLKEIHEQP
ncbi:MAG: glutamine--fructose-6-phosphate aminotransferase, partial [Clostridia bacterium]|nr:glutamine--fructose-6-phosphate aminotransferase [Clostridia bacterium]